MELDDKRWVLMKILITGGAGFIGSTLANELIKDNNEVVVFDNFSTGKMKNLDESSKLKIIEGDLTSFHEIDKLMSEKYEVIYHLGAIASVEASLQNPVFCNEVNFIATINLLEQLRKKQPETKFVFASSAAVYGANSNLPLSECEAVNPMSPYAIDKYAAEQYVINYSKLYGINTSAVRFFNVFGPKQDAKSPYSGVISIMLDKFLSEDRTFNLYGDGNQTRDFIYVKDLVIAIIKVANATESIGTVYNIGSGISTSIETIITSLERLTQKKLSINYLDERKGDIRHSLADISCISELGFVPKFKINEGLKLLIEYENKQRYLFN